MPVPEGEREPGVELAGVPVVPLPAQEGSDPTEDPALVDAGAPLPVGVALELQVEVATGTVALLWGAVPCPGVVVLLAGVAVLWHARGFESVSAEVPAV